MVSNLQRARIGRPRTHVDGTVSLLLLVDVATCVPKGTRKMLLTANGAFRMVSRKMVVAPRLAWSKLVCIAVRK